MFSVLLIISLLIIASLIPLRYPLVDRIKPNCNRGGGILLIYRLLP